MAQGHGIPPPPNGPNNIVIPPPPPSALPLHVPGPPRGPPQQIPQGQPNVPHGNLQQQGPGGFQPGGQMQGTFPMGQGQGNKDQKQNQTSKATTFKYYKVQKPIAKELPPDVKPTWAFANYTEVPWTSLQVEDRVRELRARSKKTAIEEYNVLPSAMQRGIDRLFEQQRRLEKDPAMESSIAAIEVPPVRQTRTMGRVSVEPSHISVYVMRALNPALAGAGGAKAGGGLQMPGGLAGQGVGMNNQKNMQNGMPNQQHGGQGGNFPLPPNLPINIPGAPGQGINVPGQFPAPVNVIQNNKGNANQHHKKDDKKHRNGHRNRHMRRGNRGYRDDDDSDGSRSDSDRDSDGSSNSSDEDRKFERRYRKLSLNEELDMRDRMLYDQMQKEIRRMKLRRASSPARLPPPPMGINRRPSHEFRRARQQSRERRPDRYVPRLTIPKPDPQKIAFVERIHYQSPDDSDGSMDRSERSNNTWGGQSAFSRPRSDPMTPPHSPGWSPRHSRDSLYTHPPGHGTYRVHEKPPRNVHYPPSPPSPPFNETYWDEREIDRRSRSDLRPGFERRNTLPMYLPESGKYYPENYGGTRPKLPYRDAADRVTKEALEHMLATQRAKKERGRKGSRDWYRRGAEEKYYGHAY